MQFDLLITGGELVSHAGRGRADIGIRDGRIAAIGDLARASAAETYDASHLTILPGVIDSQVHLREPGLEWKDDLAHGGDAAVLGGVTCVFEMPNTEPPTTNIPALEDKLSRAAGRMRCDFAFYAGGTRDNAEELARMEQRTGCAGVKVFMGSSTGSLLVEDDDGVRRILKTIKRRAAFHSEDEYRLRERAELARPGDCSSHPDVRDVEAAVLSTKRLIRLAEEERALIHVLHISTADEVPLLAQAKAVASMEVTPQHLTFTAPEAYERLGSRVQMNPPIRDPHHREALWAAVEAGTADILGSDHAPHTLEEKAKPYPGSPSGMPGVQTLLPVMLTHVAEGRLSLERLVDLTSHGPQRVFGLADKGRVAEGWHADLTIVDLKRKETITDSWMASKCGWTPYDGMQAHGWPVATIIRGQFAMRDQELCDVPSGAPIRFYSTLKEETS